jgi:hypothetical protein
VRTTSAKRGEDSCGREKVRTDAVRIAFLAAYEQLKRRFLPVETQTILSGIYGFGLTF